jgi:hypothetical protein
MLPEQLRRQWRELRESIMCAVAAYGFGQEEGLHLQQRLSVPTHQAPGKALRGYVPRPN